MRLILTLIFFAFVCIVKAEEVSVNFYSQQLRFVYSKDLLIKHRIRQKDKNIQAFYDKFNKSDYRKLLLQFKEYKDSFQLNDWFYYKLIQKTVDVIYYKKSSDYRAAVIWFLLLKAGYHARLVYDSELSLYVYSQDKLYESYSFTYDKKKYYNLSYYDNITLKRYKEVKFSAIKGIKNGKPFSFDIGNMPSLNKEQVIEREVTFAYKDQSYSFNIKINKSVIDIMKGYPKIETQKYFDIPVSDPLYTSLIIPLKELIKGKDEYEAVKLLLSFVRTTVRYKDDMEVYRSEKPMIPEEVLYYPHGDCEDKSALFFYLVKEIMRLPMVVLAYPNHVNVGVALDKAYGNPVEYNAKKYSICDASFDTDKEKIGDSPIRDIYEPKVIYSYDPWSKTGE